jgi:hypothetical protein
MTHDTTCKFCGVPVEVTMDDDYAAIGDQFKLLPKVACNRCADFRVKKRQLFQRIDDAVRLMRLIPGREIDTKEKAKDAVRLMLQQWFRMLATHRKCRVPEWDEEILNVIVENPQELWNAISRASKLVDPQREMAI